MIHKFTLALYNKKYEVKHDEQSWDCNYTNAKSIFNIAKSVMNKKIGRKYIYSKIVIVNIDTAIDFINEEL
jgi:hypothetical protein